MNSRSLKDYAKDVRAVQWFICVIPLGGRLLQKQSAFAFPPLGVDTGIIVFFVMALCGVAAILPFEMTLGKGKSLLLFCSFFLIICSTIAYFYLGQKYIVTVPIPDGGKMSVSVGNVRTPFANEIADLIASRNSQKASDVTDADLLMEHGPYENEVKKFWTEDSIDWVRLRLFISYLGVLILLNFVIGLIAKDGRPSPST